MLSIVVKKCVKFERECHLGLIGFFSIVLPSFDGLLPGAWVEGQYTYDEVGETNMGQNTRLNVIRSPSGGGEECAQFI